MHKELNVNQSILKYFQVNVLVTKNCIVYLFTNITSICYKYNDYDILILGPKINGN